MALPKIDIKKIAAEVVSVGLAIGAVLAVLLNSVSTLHISDQYVAWIVTASSVVTALVAFARPYANAKLKTLLHK